MHSSSHSDNLNPVREFLEGHSVVAIAVGDEAGQWSAPVLFAADKALTLYFLSSPSSRHIPDPAFTGSVSAAIYAEYKGDWQSIRGVQLEGRLFSVDESDRPRVESLYFNRFPEVRDLIEKPASEQEKKIGSAFEKSLFYALKPAKIRFVDNSKGFASRTDWLFSSL